MSGIFRSTSSSIYYRRRKRLVGLVDLGLDLAVSIARWLLDEASSGQSPTVAADDTGNGNDLDDIDYGGTDLNWTSIGAGNGLEFPSNDHAAIAELNDIANNGNIGSELDGAQQFSFILRADFLAGGASGNRVFVIGTSSGDGDIGLIVDSSTGVQVRVNFEVESNGRAIYASSFPTGLHTWGVTVDTTETVQADRVKLYKDGVLQTVTTSDVVLDTALTAINATNRIVSIGNRPSLNRGAETDIYYVELFTGKLTATEHTTAHDALVIDNDSDWDDGGTPFIGVGIAGAYEWNGQVGLQSLGLDLEGVAGAYEWNGQVGLQSLGLDLEGIAGAYEWNGQVGLQSLGLDLEGIAGAYEWAGQPGQEIRGLSFEGVAGAYEWTGFIGGFNVGISTPFNGIGIAGQYEWSGQVGLLEIGLDLEGVAGAYEWSGQVGLLESGLDLEGVAGAYEWSGQIGQLVRGLSFEGAAGAYEWSGQPGQEVRGFNPLEGQTGLYEWAGFPGILVISAPVGDHINDCVLLSLELLGFTGSRNDMLLEYYQANGATLDNIDDAEREFLLARGVAEAQVNDMWLAYFDARAFGTSTLNDGAFQFWCINGGAI